MSRRERTAPSRGSRDGSDARSWDVADWGSGSVVTVARTPAGLLSVDEAVALHGRGAELEKPAKVVHPDLDQFRSTAIAGNDLLSSCLYTSGICANYAGPLAPVALLLVSISAFRAGSSPGLDGLHNIAASTPFLLAQCLVFSATFMLKSSLLCRSTAAPTTHCSTRRASAVRRGAAGGRGVHESLC